MNGDDRSGAVTRKRALLLVVAGLLCAAAALAIGRETTLGPPTPQPLVVVGCWGSGTTTNRDLCDTEGASV